MWSVLLRIQLVLIFDWSRLLNSFILYRFFHPRIAPLSANLVHNATHVNTPFYLSEVISFFFPFSDTNYDFILRVSVETQLCNCYFYLFPCFVNRPFLVTANLDNRIPNEISPVQSLFLDIHSTVRKTLECSRKWGEVKPTLFNMNQWKGKKATARAVIIQVVREITDSI